MANTIKQSSQNKPPARPLKATAGPQIFNKLTLKKTSVPGVKARRSVYKQRQTNTRSEDRTDTVKTHLSNSCSEPPTLVQGVHFACFGSHSERKVMTESNNEIRHFKERKYRCSVNKAFTRAIRNIMTIFLPDAGAGWRSQPPAGRARRRGPPSPAWRILTGSSVQRPLLPRQLTSRPGRVVPLKL